MLVATAGRLPHSSSVAAHSTWPLNGAVAQTTTLGRAQFVTTVLAASAPVVHESAPATYAHARANAVAVAVRQAQAFATMPAGEALVTTSECAVRGMPRFMPVAVSPMSAQARAGEDGSQQVGESGVGKTAEQVDASGVAAALHAYTIDLHATNTHAQRFLRVPDKVSVPQEVIEVGDGPLNAHRFVPVPRCYAERTAHAQRRASLIVTSAATVSQCVNDQPGSSTTARVFEAVGTCVGVGSDVASSTTSAESGTSGLADTHGEGDRFLPVPRCCAERTALSQRRASLTVTSAASVSLPDHPGGNVTARACEAVGSRARVGSDVAASTTSAESCASGSADTHGDGDENASPTGNTEATRTPRRQETQTPRRASSAVRRSVVAASPGQRRPSASPLRSCGLGGLGAGGGSRRESSPLQRGRVNASTAAIVFGSSSSSSSSSLGGSQSARAVAAMSSPRASAEVAEGASPSALGTSSSSAAEPMPMCRSIPPRTPPQLRRACRAEVAQNLRSLLDGTLGDDEAQALAEELLFESLPRENVAELRVELVGAEWSRRRFVQALRADGGRWSRVRVTWHLPGSAQAISAITESGICCDEEHCACGRYGRGGYVALSAAKANAYADSDGEGGTRHLFLVLALPEEETVYGERGLRPSRTAADLPSHPTEYCFVDAARLHCACLLTYRWVATGRREKVTTAGPRVSHIVPRRSPRVGEVGGA